MRDLLSCETCFHDLQKYRKTQTCPLLLETHVPFDNATSNTLLQASGVYAVVAKVVDVVEAAEVLIVIIVVVAVVFTGEVVSEIIHSYSGSFPNNFYLVVVDCEGCRGKWKKTS